MTQAIVLGANADALVAAHLLARDGRQVTLIEEPGAVASDSGWVPPAVPSALRLISKAETPDPWARIALADGGTLELWRDVQRSAEALRRISPRDAERWPAFCVRMAALARLFERLYTEAPSEPLNLRLALRVRGLGRQGMVDLMRVLPMSVAELLDDWFESDALKGALAAMGILHLQQGPRSSGTAFRFLHHHVGSAEGVFRPTRSNLRAELLQRAGPAVRRAQVKAIRIDAGRVVGVVLDGGEEVKAQAVISALDPRRTLLELADPAWLDPELAREVGHIRRRGVVARVLFKGAAAGNLVLAPSLDYLERAYDASKYGRVSAQPYLEAAPVEDVTEVHFQYAPYRRADGPWTETHRGELIAVARAALAPHLPAISNAPASALTPVELERQEAWPEGQAYHAELALDQALWMRPLPVLAQYRTPVEGLWLCGPGTHPGGGILGASGLLCARAIQQSS